MQAFLKSKFHAKASVLSLVLVMSFAANAQSQETPDPQAPDTNSGVNKSIVDKLRDPSRQPYKVEPDSTSNKNTVISVRDLLFERQIAHEKSLIDKFLLGVAILFSIIAMLLFVSLPPQKQNDLSAKTN